MYTVPLFKLGMTTGNRSVRERNRSYYVDQPQAILLTEQKHTPLQKCLPIHLSPTETLKNVSVKEGKGTTA